MNYYISDMHFGHTNVIGFDQRPYDNREQMEKALINNWNRKVQIVLCHFPIADWNGMSYGTYHIYGHIHSRKSDTYQFMKTRDRALNAGCMINGYEPVTLQELIYNNYIFEQES